MTTPTLRIIEQNNSFKVQEFVPTHKVFFNLITIKEHWSTKMLQLVPDNEKCICPETCHCPPDEDYSFGSKEAAEVAIMKNDRIMKQKTAIIHSL